MEIIKFKIIKRKIKYWLSSRDNREHRRVLLCKQNLHLEQNSIYTIEFTQFTQFEELRKQTQKKKKDRVEKKN